MLSLRLGRQPGLLYMWPPGKLSELESGSCCPERETYRDVLQFHNMNAALRAQSLLKSRFYRCVDLLGKGADPACLAPTTSIHHVRLVHPCLSGSPSQVYGPTMAVTYSSLRESWVDHGSSCWKEHGIWASQHSACVGHHEGSCLSRSWTSTIHAIGQP
jgi:hypothetical protein